MGKNIIILSDGTGQEGGVGHNSNIYKLYNMLQHRSPEQIAYYDKGIGTGLIKIIAGGTGLGISKNIQECYKFIFDNYQTGDNIYLFGFSRGATTVRSLSSFIHLFGILPQSRPELIKKAYKIYKIGKKSNREQQAKAFIKKHNTMWCKIKFIGVWDTVAALGIPIKAIDVIFDKIPFFKHSFQNLTLSPSVENAYHALAIDDERKTFHPEIWDAEVNEYQNVSQVWFSGMHTDVGGGYEEQELSDVPLEWMLDKAKSHGLNIYDKNCVTLDPSPNGFMHNSRGEKWTRFYRKKTRSWPYNTHGKPVVHSSVLKRSLNRFNKDEPSYEPWILNGEYEVES